MCFTFFSNVKTFTLLKQNISFPNHNNKVVAVSLWNFQNKMGFFLSVLDLVGLASYPKAFALLEIKNYRRKITKTKFT